MEMTGLPSDLTVVVDDMKFHLHKVSQFQFPQSSEFPLMSKCGKITSIFEELAHDKTFTTKLEEFPGGPDTFLFAVKFCYGIRAEFTARNIITVYCAADYLEMTDEYGEDNLLSKAENFFHKNVLQNWKGYTSLFGWPMMMYGSLQSPGGSILWNGINTGARIRCTESDWWFEDISYFSVELFERLIKTMEARGIRCELLAGAIMYYARKYLPRLGRWQSMQGSKTRIVTSFSLTPAPVDQKDSLERRIGLQLELASLDDLLIPSYSDFDTLYNTDCVERIIRHFVSSESGLTLFSPPSLDLEPSSSSEPLRKVARIIDSYLAEVASNVNLKPGKIRSLAGVLPESSRPLHDGLYRALDIYFKAHPWLSDREKEELCNIIDYQKLSIDACAHASQNERLPLRVILQVLFFEQMHLRTALAGCFNVLEAESAPTGQGIAPTEIASNVTATSEMAGQFVQRDGWVTVVCENRVLKVDMEKMRSRVGELEEEFSKIKQEMKRATKSHSSLSSPGIVARKFGCKLGAKSSDAQMDVVGSTGPTPRPSVEQACSSRNSSHRKSFSLF
ncbi:BTB/POZ domain-containing protein [Hibiscus syriacus]|uniref:BTB/POZ domain-containing protein n=1 Tax=Hibiscus syriacus TaxID=106335 RepID=A0A6A2ZIR2_HIBSY|nr:BTB/POZ domain-containing protein [Hibiscus syriacus]